MIRTAITREKEKKNSARVLQVSWIISRTVSPMSFCKIQSGIFVGVQFFSVEIECVHTRRLPFFQILGCSAVQSMEMRERVAAALESSGFRLPARRFTIRLHPNLPHFPVESLDLALALSLLCSCDMIPKQKLHRILVMGSLGLDGEIRPIHAAGLIPTIIEAYEGAILPFDDTEFLPPSALERGGGFNSLKSLVEFLRSDQEKGPRKQKEKREGALSSPPEIPAHSVAKRALEIAAAGSHHLLFLGDDAVSEKLALFLHALLPPAPALQRGEISTIHQFFRRPSAGERPFYDFRALPEERLPYRKLSLSLAHRGILFLPEEAWRQKEFFPHLDNALVDRSVSAAYSGLSLRFPAEFIAVGSQGYCLCGAKTARAKTCQCLKRAGHNRFLWKRDFARRFDLRLALSGGGESDLTPFETRWERVNRARARAEDRRVLNGQLKEADIFSLPWSQGALALWRSEKKLGPESIALARVGVTICDLREGQDVSEQDLLEARYFRYEWADSLGLSV